MKNMKKPLILALSLVLVSVLSVASTLAFYNSKDSKVNVMTAGNVQIELVEQQRNEKGDALEDFEQGKALIPLVGSAQGTKDEFGMPDAKNYQDKIISVKNDGANDAYVRVLIAYPAVLKQGSIASNGTNNTNDALHANLGNRVNLEGKYTEEWGNKWKENWHWDYTSVEDEIVTINGVEYLVECLTYTDILSSDAQTSAALAGVYLDSRVNYENGVYVLDGVELTGFNGVVTIPVIAQAVQADGFATAIEAFEEVFPYGEENANLEDWFNNTGLVVATPETTVRPAGFDPVEANVNEVDGLTVIDNSAEGTNLRALYTKSGKIDGNFTVSNSYLDGTYAMNVIGNDTGVLTVTNTDLRGWVSYDGFTSATFTNSTFGKNTNPEIYNTIRPYADTTFVNCELTGTELWLDKLPSDAKVTFVNCTMNGEVIDEVTDLTLPYDGAESVVIK